MAKKKAKLAFDRHSYLATANGGRKLTNYRKGDVIHAQGDPADSVSYVQRGRVKLEVTSTQGKQAVIAVLRAEDFFGEGCLIGQATRLSAAVAMTDCRVMRVKKAEMARALKAEPSLAELFTNHVLERSSRTEEDLVDQLFNSSEKRLARTLLLLAKFDVDGRPEPVNSKVSQEMLAEMIGTTRSRVSHFMNKFRKRGLIEYNGGLKVNKELLRVVLDDDGPSSSIRERT